MFFKKRRERQITNIINEINKKNIVKRYLMLLSGCLIVAFAFNLFFLRYDIVCFGVSGVSIVLKEFGVDPSTFILLANIFLIIITYFFLGVEEVKNQIVGALTYPIFIKLTLYVTDLIDFGHLEMIVIAIFGGILAGIGYGLIYKSRFSTGGTDVLGLLICKYSKISMGNAMMFVNIAIITIGKMVFSWEIVMYAIVVAYLISIATDKILLGISNSKAFYIVADKDKDDLVIDFLNSLPGVGCTVMDASGGYSNSKQTLILAVGPTKSYFIIKEGLKEIDDSIFYLVCDSYEVIRKEDIL
ncbi:MAG: YitT family protein [Bacilli bacterium]|nr:YitT family protein [Bacilli bacterium]